MKIRILSTLGLFLIIHSCTFRSDSIIAPTAATTPADQAEAVKGNNQFALDLYRVLAAGNDKNLFFSPLSISTNLAMVTAGARGQTEAELRQAQHITLPAERAFAAMGNLLYELRERGSGRVYSLLIGNRVWVRQDIQLQPAYADVMRKDFGAETGGFESAGQAAQAINAWTDRQTRGEIKEAIKALDPEDVAALVNAIYFSGKWVKKFDRAKTREGLFFLSSGEEVTVPMMSQEENFCVVSRPGYQALVMPYQGDGLVMAVLLPDRPGYSMQAGNTAVSLSDVEKSLDGNTLTSLLRSQGESEILVSIPKLKLETGLKLNDALGALGVRAAFGPAADLSGMASVKNLFLSRVEHKAVVEVDEEGTKAAAVTVGVITQSIPPSFIADHPFLFIIGDTRTGAILFMGRVMDPRKTE